MKNLLSQIWASLESNFTAFVKKISCFFVSIGLGFLKCRLLTQPHIFFRKRNETFLFFKIESWNFQHLIDLGFRESSQNFSSYSDHFYFLEPMLLIELKLVTCSCSRYMVVRIKSFFSAAVDTGSSDANKWLKSITLKILIAKWLILQSQR